MAENPRIEELRRRVLADPASIAFAALAEEFRRVGRYDEAIETCRTGLQRHPAYLSARVTLGRALIETGDYAGAREQLETVLRSAPENLAAIRGIAQIDERLGHSTEMDPQLADMAHSIHVESLRAAATERVPVVSQAAPVEPAPEVAAAPERQPEPEIADVFFAPERSTEPEPELSLAPEPASSLAPEPTHSASMAPEPAPASNASAPHDVFASFAPASSAHVPAQDLSFDLSSAFSIQQPAHSREEAPIDFSTPRADVEPVSDHVVELDAHSYVERASEAVLEPEPVVQPEPVLQPEPVQPEPAFGAEPVLRPEPVQLEPAFEAELLLHPELVSQAEPVFQPEPVFEVDAAFEPEPESMTEAGPDPEVLATLARLERFLDAIQSLRA
jgi:hypothetical protein